MKDAALAGCGLVQVGFVVKDVDKIAEKFGRLVGMEVSAVVDTGDMDLDTWELRGKQVGARAKIKVFRFGNIELEFIQPLEGESTWHEFLNTKGEGIQHIAFSIKGMQRKIDRLEQEGYEMISRGEMPGGRFAYLDATDGLKTLVELLEFD